MVDTIKSILLSVPVPVSVLREVLPALVPADAEVPRKPQALVALLPHLVLPALLL